MEKSDNQVRLQVVLARAGVASRRGAEKLIQAGRVSVNGETVTALGTKADADRDKIAVDGQAIGGAEPKVTIMLHKPDMVVTTLSDPEGRESVADLIQEEPFRFVPVGRLDFHTEGLLLLSTDGELVNRLLHPRYHVPKTYLAKVKGRVSDKAIGRLEQGVKLEDGPTRPAHVRLLETQDKTSWLEIVVTEGRNRLVRRMCDAIGHEALRVVRTDFGTLSLRGLKPGQYQYLSGPPLTAIYSAAKIGNAPKPDAQIQDRVGRMLGQRRRGRGPLPEH